VEAGLTIERAPSDPIVPFVLVLTGECLPTASKRTKGGELAVKTMLS